VFCVFMLEQQKIGSWPSIWLWLWRVLVAVEASGFLCFLCTFLLLLIMLGV
jgi:hypothetical protein